MKKILVTGGAGFIGSHLALELVERGRQVTVLDNLSPQVHGDPEKSELYQSIRKKVIFIKGDVRQRNDWHLALAGQDVVVHLAAETGTGQSMYEIDKYVDVNIRGTALMLDILAREKHTVKKVVVASSRAIYGEGKYLCDEHGEVYPPHRHEADMLAGDFDVKCPHCHETARVLPTDENSRIHPSSIYGITKETQEELALTAGKSLGIPTTAFRYQNVYGPGQSLSNPYTGILSIFSTRFKNGNPINIFEDGRESRDFVYIDDVVEGTIAGIENESADGEVFNIGSGNPTTVLTVAETLKKAYGSDSPITISGNFRLGDIRHNFADTTKSESLLQFKPKTSFEEGISHFVEWVNTQPVQEDNYEKSIEELKQIGLYK